MKAQVQFSQVLSDIRDQHRWTEERQQEHVRLYGICYEWRPSDGSRWIVPSDWVLSRTGSEYTVKEPGKPDFLKLPDAEVTVHRPEPLCSGRRMAIMRVGNAAWERLIGTPHLADSVGLARIEAVFKFPEDCRVDAVSPHHFFAHDAVALRLESPDFRTVMDGCIIPEVVAVYGYDPMSDGKGGIASGPEQGEILTYPTVKFLGWKNDAAVCGDSPRRYLEIPRTAMTDEMIEHAAKKFAKQYQGPREMVAMKAGMDWAKADGPWHWRRPDTMLLACRPDEQPNMCSTQAKERVTCPACSRAMQEGYSVTFAGVTKPPEHPMCPTKCEQPTELPKEEQAPNPLAQVSETRLPRGGWF